MDKIHEKMNKNHGKKKKGKILTNAMNCAQTGREGA